jgi:hypothetical protein
VDQAGIGCTFGRVEGDFAKWYFIIPSPSPSPSPSHDGVASASM